MPAEFVSTGRLPAEPAEQRALLGDAATLLMRAAAPERTNLLHGIAWLTLAAGLEALGPAIAKLVIDHYLLPRNAQTPSRANSF